jgi:serine/threonine protein kinase
MEDVRADLIGEIVDGRFRIEARLGGGGMGTVWRVQHVVSLQRFALKTLDASYAAHPEATRRFVREARAAAALRTRHVVKIIDAQMQYRHKAQPLPFLVMELLEGRTLLEVLEARSRLELGELGWLAGQLGRALEAAHRQGIVHRDLKPSNVFIAEDDEGQPTIKLCDFGIAKLIDPAGEGSLETHTGALLGTPMYLAPELLRGAADAVPATDQWALGLLAYRALAGTEYFSRARGLPGLVLAIANDPMVPPSALAPSIPVAFDDWFLRSCARDPSSRFPDVAAQVSALAAALRGPAPRPISPHDAAVAARLGREPERDAAPPARSVQPTASPPAPQLPHVRPSAATRPRTRRIVFVTTVAWAVGALAAVTWIEGRLRTKEVHAATAPAPPALPPSPPARVAPVAPTNPAIESAPAAATPAPIRQRPLASGKEKRAHRRHAETSVHAAPAVRVEAPSTAKGPAQPAVPAPASPVRAPAEPGARGKAKGASCQRSAECASGLCAAETCL